MNKKVIGAKKHLYEGILFDSKLEITCYQALKDANLEFSYGEATELLVPAFRLDRVNFYQAQYHKKKLIGYGETLLKDGSKQAISKMTYTPDFFLHFGKYLIYIETKGNPNDVYPYKRKLFFQSLENVYKDSGIEIFFFEPRNKKQIIESIKKIKELQNEVTKDTTTLEKSHRI